MIWKIVLAVLVLLALIQVIRPARTNPPVDPAKTIDATLKVDPAAGAILERSCKDCHSNRTVWPWYSAYAPFSWLLTHDVNDGRRKFNMSEWGSYDAAESKTVLNRMCREVTEGDMPPRDYTVLHSGTTLSEADVKTLCDWAMTAAR